MPIDFEEMKKRNAQNSKSRKSDKKEIIPLIKPEKSTANKQEIKNRIKEKLKEKLGGNNMVRKEKITKKGSSGLGESSNTKKDYDYLVSGVNEAQQKAPKESTIGVRQPINSIELLKVAENLGMNQDNNGGGNNNNLLNQLKDLAILRDLFNPQPQKQGGGNDNAMIKMMSEQNRMMQQTNMEVFKQVIENSNIKFSNLAQLISGGRQGGSPEDNLRSSMNLVKEIQGEQRVRTKDELDFGLKKQELVLKESSRQDMLDREERAIIREDKKSERMLGIGEVVLDKIVGNGLGNLVNDVMSAGGKKGKRRGREAEPTEKFDISLLDEDLIE